MTRKQYASTSVDRHNFTFLCTFSACYAMRSAMSQINEYDDDDDDDLVTYLLT